MASEERNALAELAHTLCGVVIDDECYATVGECVDAMNAIKKARFIIAELAKVEYKFAGDNLVERDFEGLENAFLNSRAIAAEGANDGN